MHHQGTSAKWMCVLQLEPRRRSTGSFVLLSAETPEVSKGLYVAQGVHDSSDLYDCCWCQKRYAVDDSTRVCVLANVPRHPGDDFRPLGARSKPVGRVRESRQLTRAMSQGSCRLRSHRTRFILPCIGCLVAGARRHSPTSATLTRIQVCRVTLCEFSDSFPHIDIPFDSCHFVDALRRNLTRTLGKISALRRAHSHHLILSDRQRYCPSFCLAVPCSQMQGRSHGPSPSRA